MSRFKIDIDAEHGGRWTELHDPSGRQWLWQRPDPARDHVRPGDSFVDVGGLEECYPTIGADPDHGELWTRPWTSLTEGGAGRVRHEVAYESVRLTRSIRSLPEGIEAHYLLEAEPGTRFIWAAHALLELGVGATLIADDGPARAWPDHKLPVETTWPRPLDIDYATLGPDDGSAMFCLLPGRAEVAVADGRDVLRFRLECEGQPVSVGLWRNLGGYPWGSAHKYRNVGVEPMLGRVFDLTAADPQDAALVPGTGQVEWTLRIDNG